MDEVRTFGSSAIPGHTSEAGSGAATRNSHEKIVCDHLPDSFALDRSESEWLLTLLSADELRYIFEGSTHADTDD